MFTASTMENSEAELALSIFGGALREFISAAGSSSGLDLTQATKILEIKLRYISTICKNSGKPIEECAISMLDQVIRKQASEKLLIPREVKREKRIFGIIPILADVKIIEW